MSVIVARTTLCCVPSVVNTCFPAIPIEITIPVGMTVSVDSVSAADYRAVKWLISVANTGESEIRLFEVYSTHQNGASPTFNYYAIEGSMMSIVVDVIILGGNLTLQITNNEATILTVYAIRIGVPVNTSIIPAYTGIDVASRNSFVPTLSTVTIDEIAFPTYRGAKWLVNVYDPTSESAQVCQVFALMGAGMTGFDVSYGFTGDLGLSYVLNTVAVAGDLELQLTNSSEDLYHVNVTRFPIIQTPVVPDCGAPFAKVFLWIPPPPTITPGSTVTVDTPRFDPVGTVAVKWLVSIFQSSSSKVFSFELEATLQSAGVCSFVEYGLLGVVLTVDVNVAIVGETFEFTIKNNEASDIIVNATRLPVFS